jgi:putative ABC transport system ATP-binding protein
MLEAAGITRRGDDGRLLLDHFDLVVSPGDRLALSGPSGSGKSQLLRALALLDPVESGEVLWEGSPVADDDVPRFRSRVIYQQQAPALFEGAVEENLRRPFALGANHDRQFDPQRASRLFAELGRSDLESRPTIADLSGGEQQIIALVRVLLLEPIVLLLDEPTTALDPDTERRVIEVIGSWVNEEAEGRALVWVSHDERLVNRIATCALRLGQGRLEVRQ